MKSLKLSVSALALVFAAAPVGAQLSGGNAAATPPPSSKQAEYDCSGMTWIALDNCLRLNADNARPSTSVVAPLRGGAHDCSGMIGAPLETCLKLNGQAESVGTRSNGSPTTGVVDTERAQRAQPEPGAK